MPLIGRSARDLNGNLQNIPSLSKLLKHGACVPAPPDANKTIKELQLRMLRVQQGLFFTRTRAIIAIEGFDASGKGGAIRRLTEPLDPRSAIVYPIGPPTPDEQGKHWLYRFWTKLPSPGTLAIFDRTWYGRVLVERVEKLTPKQDWKRAFGEINEFEKMLMDDGVDLVKIFLAISADEQCERFRERIENPYKQWKLTEDDIRARKHWDDYVDAVDDAFAQTHSQRSPWHVVPADDKDYARVQVLKIVTDRLSHHRKWMEEEARKTLKKSAENSLRELKKLC